MAYTYEPVHRGDLDRVRFHIQDVERNEGPLPEDANFSDEEIESILDYEGSWQRTVAACFERLAAAWRKFPNLESDQFGLSRSHISRGYAEDADRWRKEWGYSGDTERASGNRAGSAGYYRVDGFSSDAIVGEADAV